VTVLFALVECDGKHTLVAMMRCSGEHITLCGLSRFLHTHQWQSAAVVAVWLTRFRTRLAALVLAASLSYNVACAKDKPAPVTGFLIFDDSVHYKPKAKKMQGLGQHYANTPKRVVAGHCLFAGLYMVLGQRVALAPQLYRQRKSYPEADQDEFQSKMQMAVSQVLQFEPVANTTTHVLVDCWYFNKLLYDAAVAQGYQISGGLKSNRRLLLPDAQAELRSRNLQDYAASLDAGFVAVRWQDDEELGSRWEAQSIVCAVSKLGRLQVVIVRPVGDTNLSHYRYFGSTLLQASIHEVIATLAVRWNIEVMFETMKDLLGSDEYQLMSAAGVVRYWALILLMYNYLEEQREERGEAQGKVLTAGEVRRELQREQQDKLLRWLWQQWSAGRSVEEVQAQLQD